MIINSMLPFTPFIDNVHQQ
jgi:hypothetical protein